jgi:DNA-binding transcriptional ArsR family regulator
LNLPISTVHYNLQHLREGGLVESDEYHYSEKGKEVNHYKLANKYIIIAPKSVWGIKEKLRGILPVALVCVIAGGLLSIFSRFFKVTTFSSVMKAAPAAEVAEQAVVPVMDEAVRAGAEILKEKAVEGATLGANAPAVNQTAITMINQTISTTKEIWPDATIWFLIGAGIAILVFFIVSLIRRK